MLSERNQDGCKSCDFTTFKLHQKAGFNDFVTRCPCFYGEPTGGRDGGGVRLDSLERIGVPAADRACVAATMTTEQKRAHLKATELLGSGSSVLLIGAAGRGKTGLAVCLLRDFAQSRATVVVAWCHVETWLRKIRETYDAKAEGVTESSLLRELLEADFAVIDDLGAHQLTDWSRGMLYAVVQGRDSEARPTVYTSNLPLGIQPGVDSIQSVYGERIYSRLSRCAHIPISGPRDLRKR
ncbi:MAG TPA: ATP-binding protein [Thermoleophilia bacterium]|nr:ATP-binding protein [Thermoleophilia bacterium]